MPFCRKCGNQLGNEDMFCDRCGQAIPEKVAATITITNNKHDNISSNSNINESTTNKASVPVLNMSSRAVEVEGEKQSSAHRARNDIGIKKSIVNVVCFIIVVAVIGGIVGCIVYYSQQSSFESFGYVKVGEFHEALQNTVPYGVYWDNIDYASGNGGSINYLAYDGVIYIYAQFEGNEDAMECFDAWYQAFVEGCTGGSFDGPFSYEVQDEGDRYSGYLLLNGDLPSNMEFPFSDSLPGPSKLYSLWAVDDIWFKGSIYGGIYLKKNAVIIVYTLDDTKTNEKTIDDFLDELDLPVPPKH